MKYVGIQTQKRRNNARSLFLLILFPCLVAGLIYLGCFLFFLVGYYQGADLAFDQVIVYTNLWFQQALPYAIGGVLLWFIIAYFSNVRIIENATDSHPLERKENKRVYNLVENLCMANGMQMPQINVIEDDSLNAFASGINKKTFTVTLTTGTIKYLDDAELEAVIAHELTHIRNNDVKLMIVSIVFVGIFSVLAQLGFQVLRSSMHTSSSRKNEKGGGVILIVIIVLVVATIGYLFSALMRFAISRNREYMADAGSAEMTKHPEALASALRKISLDPRVEAIERKDVAQLFIEDPKEKGLTASNLFGLFSTHPPIQKRIAVLEQF
ncbi:protease HtpX [Bacteroidia bacterium]|nr:protease HtpX [Bacteroidia bacterium]